MSLPSFHRTLQELSSQSNDFVAYIAPGSIALAHRDLCPSTLPCAFNTSAFLSFADFHTIKRRRRCLLRNLFLTFQLPIILLHVDQTPQNIRDTLGSLASFFSITLQALGNTYVTSDTPSLTFPTISIPVFFFNAYAEPSRTSASSEPAKRALSALLVSYQSANASPPPVTARALIQSLEASVRAGYIDVVSAITFQSSDSTSHVWDGSRLRRACPPLIGARGNYLSTAIVSKQRTNESLPYGFVMQDCVIRMLRGAVEETGLEAVKSHTGINKGFEACAWTVFEALRKKLVDGTEKNVKAGVIGDDRTYMSTETFYFVDTRPTVVRGKLALVPFCVTPELQLIYMLVVSMVVWPIGLGGTIVLIVSAFLCARACSMKRGDKLRIWGTRWSGGEVLGHLRRVLTSVGVLVLPVLGMLHIVDHLWTRGQVGVLGALLTIYMPGFLTGIRFGLGRRGVRMARDSVEKTRKVVGDFLSVLIRERAKTNETEYLDGEMVMGSGEYVHAAHVPSDLLERWGEDYWYHLQKGEMMIMDKGRRSEIGREDTTMRRLTDSRDKVVVRYLQRIDAERGKCSEGCCGCLVRYDNFAGVGDEGWDFALG